LATPRRTPTGSKRLLRSKPRRWQSAGREDGSVRRAAVHRLHQPWCRLGHQFLLNDVHSNGQRELRSRRIVGGERT
jgi:hypothetical protein